MGNEHLHTHRCEGSLKARMSIRYEKPQFIDEEWGWWLINPHFDCEYDSWYTENVAKIDYCPFCGEKLTV